MLNYSTLSKLIVSLFLIFNLSACDSSTKDLIDLVIDKPSRRQIDTSKMGVNNFFVHPEFGSITAQYSDINNTLRLKYVRVLFSWSNAVQPTPNSAPNYSFYDNIINSIPAGVDVLIVLAHSPNWMLDSANWVEGDPRRTWVEKWVKPTVSRYAGRRGIVGWEVFNEPNIVTVSSDAALGLVDPANYIDLLQLSSAAIRSLDPTRLVVGAATTSIQQDFPSSLDYNKQMRDLGAEGLIDIWNVHYYGEQYEKLLQKDGVKSFLNELSKPIWVTESGIQGSEQLAYAETVWPFLIENVPNIQRIYLYEYAHPGSAAGNYGMRTTDAQFPVSDFYIYLRDR